MVQVKKYHLPPTRLIPNSPYPLLHYKGLLSDPSKRRPEDIHDTLDGNGWETQWIFRYGATQASHYHSRIHEAMVVLSGTATIRFGVADTDPDLDKSTWGGACEEGGVEIAAAPGDVFVIPAGVAHKTYNASPSAVFSLLTPGEGRGIPGPDVRESLAGVRLSGFTMLGAYPKDCGSWDFAVGGDDVRNFEVSWNVPKSEKDPFLGNAPEGILGQWGKNLGNMEVV
ncbi:RmlC-like cupin domain-containing protein [Hypoxylon rubiginosum]|uniref:RmlC-like cupin domain-containing protein n=1 Tax=Hypoxylon rubiginosum TaxID=110542 RepID=A0ACC0DG37_9PEZI|nr:RmlC-like cupin domain-containing protein [Hypoxylon rubiginosum]